MVINAESIRKNDVFVKHGQNIIELIYCCCFIRNCVFRGYIASRLMYNFIFLMQF